LDFAKGCVFADGWAFVDGLGFASERGFRHGLEDDGEGSAAIGALTGGRDGSAVTDYDPAGDGQTEA
jgi:hypothetical protein